MSALDNGELQACHNVALHPGNVRANCSIKGPLCPPVHCSFDAGSCSVTVLTVISNQLAQHFLSKEPSTIDQRMFL